MVFLDTEVYKGQWFTDSGFLDIKSYTIFTMVLYFLRWTIRTFSSPFSMNHDRQVVEKIKCTVIKADMKSYIPLETAAIFFLANLFPKQCISSEYVTAYFICMGLLWLQGAKTENYKMKNSCPYRDSNSRTLILKSSALSMRLSSLIYER